MTVLGTCPIVVPDGSRGPEATKTKACISWLKEFLGTEWKGVKEICEAGKAKGFAMGTIYSASEWAGVLVKSGCRTKQWANNTPGHGFDPV